MAMVPSRQTKDLCLFVTSDNPDVYINVMGYCMDHFELGRVVLISIIKDRGQRGAAETHLGRLKDGLAKQLLLLQDGKYLYKEQNSKSWKEKEIDIPIHSRARYAKLASQSIMSQVFIYSDLEEEIDALLTTVNYSCIFDLSAILKAYLVDVFIVLLSRNIRDIYTFELRLRERSHDEKELIHSLSTDNGDYEYVDLTQSHCVKDKIIKRKDEAVTIDRAIGLLDKMVDTMASNFASRVMLVYAALILALYIVIAIKVSRADWNKVEPWTFILLGMPLFPYAGSILTHLILQKEISLRPGMIFNWLKRYKKSNLTKNLGITSILNK